MEKLNALKDDREEAEELSKKIQARGTGIKRNPFEIGPEAFIEPVPILHRKRGNKRRTLNL